MDLRLYDAYKNVNKKMDPKKARLVRPERTGQLDYVNTWINFLVVIPHFFLPFYEWEVIRILV